MSFGPPPSCSKESYRCRPLGLSPCNFATSDTSGMLRSLKSDLTDNVKDSFAFIVSTGLTPIVAFKEVVGDLLESFTHILYRKFFRFRSNSSCEIFGMMARKSISRTLLYNIENSSSFIFSKLIDFGAWYQD